MIETENDLQGTELTSFISFFNDTNTEIPICGDKKLFHLVSEEDSGEFLNVINHLEPYVVCITDITYLFCNLKHRRR